MGSVNINCPERRTAIVARELARYDIDIAALSEASQADEGQLKEHEGGNTFFWKGKPSEERCIHRIGFAVKNNTANELSVLLLGIDKCLMMLHLKLSHNQYATISVYAPTLNNNEDNKQQFYYALDAVLTATAKQDKFILMSDFNARLRRHSKFWSSTIGKSQFKRHHPQQMCGA